ncbi:hypothetical protein FF38_11490 [Lucilia cuprina]|uniref:MADF domain-containing protein n=1 Tax=Lucilia cuprina TaxID=7375 RepID=A0A0L0CDL7_LUCCU|nr:hypothetical protein CVS40_2873 [Lucilia cuprina]KNC29569.1 hypothetical protein FF38_11490 [Lucilia cuprina]
MENNKKFWMEFLDIYQAHPELWNFKGDDNKNEQLKESAYNILLQKMKELIPEATRDLVLKKLNVFRSSYRRENRKVKDSMRSGSSQADIYKPKWLFYEKLKFLDDKEDDNNVISPFDNDVTFAKTSKKTEKEPLENDLLQSSEDEEVHLFKYMYAKLQKINGKQKKVVQRIILEAIFAADECLLDDNILRKFLQSLYVNTPSTSTEALVFE